MFFGALELRTSFLLPTRKNENLTNLIIILPLFHSDIPFGLDFLSQNDLLVVLVMLQIGQTRLSIAI